MSIISYCCIYIIHIKDTVMIGTGLYPVVTNNPPNVAILPICIGRMPIYPKSNRELIKRAERLEGPDFWSGKNQVIKKLITCQLAITEFTYNWKSLMSLEFIANRETTSSLQSFGLK